MAANAEYKIEDGIPPPRRGNLAAQIRAMTAGQSLLVSDRPQGSVASQGNSASKIIGDGRKYTTKQVDGGVRIWRIA